MQYNKKELETLSLEIIENEKLWIVEHICAYLPCHRATFYNHGLDKLDSIKEAIFKVQTKRFNKAFVRLEDNESASAQIATVKALGSQDIRDALNGRVEEKVVKEVRVIIERKSIKSRDDIAND